MIKFLTVLFISFIFQVQLLPAIGLKLDLMILITVYWGLLRGWRVGLGVGLLVGILQDVFSGGPLGMSAVGLVVCGLLAGYCRRMLLLRYWLVRVSLVFLLTILNFIIYFSLLSFLSGTKSLYVLQDNWFVVSLGNTILAALVFWLQDRYG